MNIIGGRRKSRHMHGVRALSRYLSLATIDAAPPARDWIGSTTFQYFGNSIVGDCTVASLYDRQQLLAGLTGETFSAPDSAAIYDYEQITGYDGKPGDATDNGAQMIDVITYGENRGINGRKILGKARVDVGNQDEMRAACNLGCGLYVGVNLPKALDDQGYTWTIPPLGKRGPNDSPDPDRGHAIYVGGYDRETWQIVTWASGKYTATNEWMAACADEAWVLLDDALVTGARPAPNGFDLERLRADMGLVTA